MAFIAVNMSTTQLTTCSIMCILCSGWSGGAPVLAAGQDPVLARPPLLPLLDVHPHLHGVLHQAAARMQVGGDETKISFELKIFCMTGQCASAPSWAACR